MSTSANTDKPAPLEASNALGWQRFDVALGLGLTAILFAARVVAYVHAGALWRDEVHSVNMASQPACFETWLNDSFPVLWLLVLRGWIGLGFGGSDMALRGVGLLCGALHVAALWWTGRQLGARVPWALLLLFGLHPTLIVYGDEVRGYGLGILTQLLMIGATWRCIERPTWRRFALLQIAALLAVQAAYANSFMVLAAFAGGGLVCLRRRDIGSLAGLTAVGLVSADSVAPYILYELPRANQSLDIVRRAVPWHWHIGVFREALDVAGPATWLVWATLVALALSAAVFVAWGARGATSGDHGVTSENHGATNQDPSGTRAAAVDLAWFLLGNITVGTLGFWWYIRFLQVPTQVWYYLPFMTLLAVCIELARQFGEWGKPWLKATQLTAIAVVFALMAGPTWRALAFRFTNVDLLAREISKEAKVEDLVVVFPWYVGLTYARYDRGAVPSMNFPDVGRRSHAGYREMKTKMQRVDPIRDELSRLDHTLRHGGRVWVLGDLDYPPPGERIERLGPAPDPVYGWSEEAYTKYWWQQAVRLLQSRAHSIRSVAIPAPVRAQINPCENVSLYVVEGWRK